ncbi:MAG: hypothetical protein AAF211_09695 [Myxococcota bacterium]
MIRRIFWMALTSGCLTFGTSDDEPGFTTCGSFDTCAPGTYCEDAAFGTCTPGCTSDVNCAANQRCVDNEDDGVGVCASSATAPDPDDPATPEQRARCKDDCDAYAFFECFGEEDRQDCFTGCETASASQIEGFLSCDGALDCDTSCLSVHLP